MGSEFDRFAAEGYAGLLRDPLRERFAPGSWFFLERKLILIRDFYRRLGGDTESATWLDVGCGEGGLLALGRSFFREVAGCDVSAGMIQHCQGVNVRLQESPVRIPFSEQSFDLVTAVCVYHHVSEEDRLALTAEVSRVLKSNGIFCVIEHNPLNPLTQVIVRRTPVDSQARLLNAAIARRLARTAGMHVIETRYFLYFPQRYYAQMASIEAKLAALPLGGQYAVFCRKASTLVSD
jgi:SAM-dependent methyltransferase